MRNGKKLESAASMGNPPCASRCHKPSLASGNIWVFALLESMKRNCEPPQLVTYPVGTPETKYWTSTRSVQGVVTDSLTREPLPYTSVYLKGTTEGGMTDDKGQFSFKTYRPQAVLVISAIGYNEYTRLIHPAQGIRLTIALSPATYALNEVVVKPKRERYKKKDNPAVEFVRQMIEHRDDYSPKELDFWQRDRYEKMTFAINNFDSVKQQKWLYRKFKFLTDYVDTSAVTGKPVLAVSNRELLATDYYRKSPKSQKQRVHARKQAGVDEMLSQQGMEQASSEIGRASCRERV